MNTAENTSLGHYLQAADFKKMILGASFFFEREKEKINALNVFPVPDGDTGTNMSMTLKAAVDSSLRYTGESIGELSAIVASSALMGARGNSGVILSQILKGIARGLQKKKRISPAELSKAFQYGVVYAYRSVSKPVEGTILTVAREMARGIRTAVRRGENLYDSIEAAVSRGRITLEKTTDMLPALKEAGVVDAGGLGLLVFLEGCLFSLKSTLAEIIAECRAMQSSPPGEAAVLHAMEEPLDLEHPYCTEVLIKNENNGFNGLKAALEKLGDSLLVAADSQKAKIHIHTANPGLVLQTALHFGTLHDIKIDNMQDQHRELTAVRDAPAETFTYLPQPPRLPQGEAGVIAVSFGEGFRDIFLSLGADEIVYGGQTMNPKVEDLLTAVQNLPQGEVFILPNNKNITLVARQVKELSEKPVHVLETASIPEGLAALLAYNTARSPTDNREAMQNAIGQIKTGLVTYATRDTTVEGEVITQGEYLGLSDDSIIAAGTNLGQTALDLLRKIAGEEAEIITLYSGRDVPREEAAALAARIAAEYPGCEIEHHFGGQPIYYYIISIE